jgi:hypothetical protein
MGKALDEVDNFSRGGKLGFDPTLLDGAVAVQHQDRRERAPLVHGGEATGSGEVGIGEVAEWGAIPR